MGDVQDAAPIISITNGVHAPTWQSAEIREARRDGDALQRVRQTLRAELGSEVDAAHADSVSMRTRS